MYRIIIEGATLNELIDNLEKETRQSLSFILEMANEPYQLNIPVQVSTPVRPVQVSTPVEPVQVSTPVQPVQVSTPVEPVQVSTPVQPLGELDSVGLPWDHRIHNSMKTKMKNGEWKLTRGIDKDLVTKVKEEIREKMRSIQVAKPVQPVQVTTPVQPVQVATPVQPVQVATPVQPLPVSKSGHTFESFKTSFALIFSNLIAEGKISPEYVNDLKKYFNVSEIWAIDDNQKAILFEDFVKHNIIQEV